jgi:glyoxylase-like metal-dependent hydrolase (beta-lactamase superfamily II)
MRPFLRDEGIIRENVVQVVPDLYQLTFHASNVFVVADESLTLIDTGFRATVPRIVEFVKSLHRKPEEIRLIVLTHCHLDHAGGVRELKRLTGARIACHRADISDAGAPLPYPRAMQKTLAIRPLAALRSRLGISSAEVDIRLEGGEMLDPLGGLKVIHTPGHTSGSVCLISPRHKLLIAGDTLVRHGNGLIAARRAVSVDTAQASQSIGVLAGEDFDRICFGHHLPLMENARARLLELVARTGARSETT